MNIVVKRKACVNSRALVLGVLLMATVLGVVGHNVALAGGNPYDYTPPLVLDHTGAGDAWSCYTRPMRGYSLNWGNAEYLVVGAGIDVQIYKPDSGTMVAQGHFNIGADCGSSPVKEDAAWAQAPRAPARGLDGVAEIGVCDNCRFGVVNTWDGALIFDLGDPTSGGNPSLIETGTYTNTLSGGTYRVKVDSVWTQFVLLDGSTYGSPFYGRCPSGEMGVYKLTSSGGVAAVPTECVSETTTFHPIASQQFAVLDQQGILHQYLVYSQSLNQEIYIAEIGSTGVPVLPPINAQPLSGSPTDYINLDPYTLDDPSTPLQDRRGYLLVTNPSVAPHAQVYEIYPNTNGDLVLNPNPVWFNTESQRTWAAGAIHYPYVFLTYGGNTVNPRRLIDITAAPPGFVDFDYWDDPNLQEAYNQAGELPGKALDIDAWFSSSGQWMYFMRRYQMSRFKFTPSNPTAAINVTPSPAFWGDQVLVDGSASGGAAEYALWIDDDSTGIATSSTVVAGIKPGNSGAWSSTVTSLNWQIPNDGSTGPYYGHVAVQDTSRGYAYDPVSHPEMLATQLISLDTTPKPKITIGGVEGPFTMFKGDTATLSAEHTEGNPSSYFWELTPPSGSPITSTQASLSQTFDIQGTWNVSLDVEWVNGEYTDTATTTVTVKSALADFTFSPASPKDNEDINLDASASKPSGQLSYTWEVLNGTSPEWTGAGVTATIPKDTLVPGSYTIKLTVLNSSTNESDTLEKTLSVISGASQISISPQNPERGQTVTFSVQGISGITGIDWHFGGASCDGTPADYPCTTFCTPTTYTYRDAGTYSVRADVSTASGTTSLYGTINVQNAGSCPSTTCTYTSSITQTSFGASGGNGAVTVSANSSSCPWTATSSQGWLSLGQASGSGNANISFTVGSNPGGTRTASITVRGGSTFSRTFNITQSGSGGGAGSLSISPTSPKKGEAVTFAVQGISGISGITWHFGGASCDGSSADWNCPDGKWCTPASYTYRDAGTKSVSAVVTSDSGTQTVTGSVTVKDTGQCSGGTCDYSVQPSTTSFGPNGGTGTVAVTADTGCAWNATTTEPSWLHITGSGVGNGNGSFGFSVDKYTGTEQRTGKINVKDQTITITQGGVSKGDFMVSAAASIPGEKGTYWQTDLCIFNPDTGLAATAHVLFLPESLGPVNPVDLTPGGVNIPRLGTLCLPDVLGSQGETKGALRVKVDNAEQLAAPVVITSRTYTKQGDGGVGTYGQNVPGQSVSTVAASRLVIGGLHHYQDADGSGFRTAIGLVNQTDKDIGGIVIHLYDNQGNEVGSYQTGLWANGFLQIDRIAEKVLGTGQELRDFSAVIRFKDAQGVEGAAKEVTAYASMVDQVTGDAVFIQGVPIP